MLTPDTAVEVTRDISVASGKPYISGLDGSPTLDGGPSGLIFDLIAETRFDMTVSVTLDGVPVPGLIRACVFRCIPTSAFRYRVDLRPLAPRSGSHVLVVSVADSAGLVVKRSFEVVVNNPPAIELDSPGDQSLLFGSFRLMGRIVPDQPGSVTVRVWLDDQLLLETSAAALDQQLPLGNLPPGAHKLTVTAIGSTGILGGLQRDVVLTSSAALSLPSLLNVRHNLGALEDDLVIYGRAFEDYSVSRNVVTGAERGLGFGAWGAVSGGLAFVSERFQPDCPNAYFCMYLCDQSGNRRRLSQVQPTGNIRPAAEGGVGAWRIGAEASDVRGFEIHDSATGQLTRIAPHPAAAWPLYGSPGLSVKAGQKELVFAAEADLDSPRSDIFRWSSRTGTTTRLTQGDWRSVAPQTDGDRVAWIRWKPGLPPESTVNELVVMNLSDMNLSDGTSARVVATNVHDFELRDGLLAWREANAGLIASRETTAVDGDSSGYRVRALGQAGIVTLVEGGPEIAFYGIGAGQVVYAHAGPGSLNGQPQVWSWNAATGRSVLRVDVKPARVLLKGRWMYFSMTTALYRMALD